jgi:hypothetical protein
MQNSHASLAAKAKYLRTVLAMTDLKRKQIIHMINSRYDEMAAKHGEFLAKRNSNTDKVIVSHVNSLMVHKCFVKGIESELKQLKLSIKNSQKIPSKKLGNFELIE